MRAGSDPPCGRGWRRGEFTHPPTGVTAAHRGPRGRPAALPAPLRPSCCPSQPCPSLGGPPHIASADGTASALSGRHFQRPTRWWVPVFALDPWPSLCGGRGGGPAVRSGPALTTFLSPPPRSDGVRAPRRDAPAGAPTDVAAVGEARPTATQPQPALGRAAPHDRVGRRWLAPPATSLSVQLDRDGVACWADAVAPGQTSNLATPAASPAALASRAPSPLSLSSLPASRTAHGYKILFYRELHPGTLCRQGVCERPAAIPNFRRPRPRKRQANCLWRGKQKKPATPKTRGGRASNGHATPPPTPP